MDTIALIARNEEAVRQAIEIGDIAHIDTASEEITDEFLLFAINSGLLQRWADRFPDPRQEAEIGMDVILAASLSARFAGLYSFRQLGSVLQSARVLGALGYSVAVTEAGQGMSRRGTSDEQVVSGDVLRKLLVKSVGPSLVTYARLGKGRRLHIVDCTKVEVPLNSGQYACSGIVKNDDGSLSRGYKLATVRTLLDTAGVLTQVAIAPIQDHDLEVCRRLLTKSRVFRAGDLFLEANGFMDGELISELKAKRQIDVIVPLRSNMAAFDEAVRLAQMADKWQSHPSRAKQQIALVRGVEHVWDNCRVQLNAGVIRFWHAKKNRHAYIVLVTTDQQLTAKWMVKHYEERPEVEQDYEQMKSGGWKLQQLSTTRLTPRLRLTG